MSINRGMRIVFRLALYLIAFAAIAPANAQTFTTIINVPPDIAPSSIASDTQLNLSDGGVLGRLFAAGAPDGSSAHVEVNITGGEVRSNFAAFAGSTINISGGEVAGGFNAGPNSIVNISGGSVGRINIGFGSLIASPDSTVNISGGEVGRQSTALSGSTINIRGGVVSPFFKANLGSTINISGGEFFLNGEPVVGLESVGDSVSVDLSAANLTATLADGTVRVFGPIRFDDIRNATVNLIRSPLLPATSLINAPIDPVPPGLRMGQTLNLPLGGELPDFFTAIGSTINIDGGNVGNHFYTSKGSTVNMSDGTIGENFNASPSSTINMTGGSVGVRFNIHNSTVNLEGGTLSGGASIPPPGCYSCSVTFGTTARDSILNISGGEIGRNFIAYSGNQFNISGGLIKTGFRLYEDNNEVNMSGGILEGISIGTNNTLDFSGGVITDLAVQDGTAYIRGGQIDRGISVDAGGILTISGGNVSVDFDAHPGSTVNILGTAFFLDGQELTELVIGEAFAVIDRDVTLQGLLADGSLFSFDLTSYDDYGSPDYFDPNATLTITLVPEPGSLGLIGAGALCALWRRMK